MQKPATQLRVPPAAPNIPTSAEDAPTWLKITAFLAGATVVAGGVILLMKTSPSSSSQKTLSNPSKTAKASLKKANNLDKAREKFAEDMDGANGDPEEMIEICSKAIKNTPKLREAWFTKASLMARSGADPQELIDFCEQAINALDRDPDAVALKLSYMGSFGVADEALKELEELPSSVRQLPEFLLLKGTLLTQIATPDLKAAKVVVQKALAIRPDVEARLQYVELLERMEDPESAYKELLQAERELPDEADEGTRIGITVSKGRLLCDLRQYKESLKILRPLADSGISRVHEYIATCYILSGEGSLQEAMKELDAELAVEPNNFFASYWKAVVLCEVGDPQKALPLLDEVLEHLTEAKLPAEELADFHFCKAFPLAQMGRTKDAIESLEKCLDLNPMDEYAPREKQSLLSSNKLTSGLREYVLKKLDSRRAKNKADASV